MERLPLEHTSISRLSLYAVITGALTGLGVAALNWAVIFTERAVFGVDHLVNHDPTSAVSPLRLSLTLIGLGFILSWAWFLLDRSGSEQVSVPEAMFGKKMPVLTTLCSAFIQVMSVAAGAQVGRENAPRLMGALWGSRLAVALRIDPTARRLLVASAAGAGLGASFHLPLAGAIFTLELLLVEMSAQAVITAMLTSATAAAVTGIFVEPHPVYHSVPVAESMATIVIALVVGAFTGLLGHWFGALARSAVKHRARGRQLLWQMPLGFAVLAVISYVVPGVSANARFTTDSIFTAQSAAFGLLLLGALRMCVILLSFRVGVIGGTLTPAFGLGAIFGSLLGLALHPLFPEIPFGAFAILGAAAFLSTAMAAPMFGMIAAIEFTDMAAQGYLPVFVAVVAAALSVRFWGLLIQKEQKLAPFTSALFKQQP
ncbi:chloride channel protein [Corynebacterium hindlerae]|uniref:Chloride channel protein n=1 Tax=Corynebacterium hindlerae TaxID=699041 RepID=A0A7G5FH39_9CORY|nr:chloride channel protein [Corynebacterium hindlerae]QMV85930.1 chloride channel protein [Corynebacterium hindlerae]